jgi:hypothetical protein
LQLEEGDNGAGKAHRTDDDREGGGDQIEELWRTSADLGQLDNRHNCRRATSDTVEQRHELRHLGHLDAVRTKDADCGSSCYGGQDRQQMIGVGNQEDNHACQHRAGCTDQVAAARGLRR